MILYALLPHVEHYTAVDVSPFALESIRRELTPDEHAKVLLLNQAAHAFEGVAPGSVDTVIINSVAQYFADRGYLTEVLRRASEVVAEGGRIFVGDVRNLAHLEAFHTLAELTQAPDHHEAAELARRITRRVESESELLLAEAFFAELPRTLPRIAAVDVQLKRGSARNEMVRFRYDVVLHVGRAPAACTLEVPPVTDVATLDAIRARLEQAPPLLLLRDVPDARVADVYAARDAMHQDASLRADVLRARLADTAAQGVDPERLYTLHPDYEADVRQARSGDPRRFDVALRHRTQGPAGRIPFEPLPATRLSNEPARATDGATLERELREQLREQLPAYMVPAAFVALSALPLTPNGKIDRKALPSPEPAAPSARTEIAPPDNELEQKVAETWAAVLNLGQVGRTENIFDLGANSLLTVQAANRLGALLGRKISLVSMFRFPSVAALAAHLSSESTQPTSGGNKRKEERDERRKDAAERRRQMRAERGARSV